MEETLKELKLTLKSLNLDHLAKYVTDIYESVDKVHIAFVGEYNAGKSSLINTLLGEKVVAERDLPTTNRVVLITHCPVEKKEKLDEFTELICVNNEKLKHTVLVDTPGLSSAVREHEEALLKYLHKADLIVIVAPSNQPYTKEIENLLKLLAKEHSTQLAYVINIFEDPSVYEEDPSKLTRLKEFVREKLRNILSSEDVERTKIFAFSVRAVRKGAQDYPFLTEEWEDFKKFIFEEVITQAKKIKFNAVKEKVLKLLNNSVELENLRLKVDRLKSELQRWKLIKENVEEFLEIEKGKKINELQKFIKNFFSHLETVVEDHLKHFTSLEVAKNAKKVVEDFEETVSEYLDRAEVKKNLERILDYRPVLVKLKKIYPELRVEPTIPGGLQSLLDEFEERLYSTIRSLGKIGTVSKGLAVFFGIFLPVGLIFALFAGGEWKIFGWVITGVSAVGLLISLLVLLTSKSRLENGLKREFNRLEKTLILKLEGFLNSKLDERFDLTFANIEAEIEKLKLELGYTEEKLKKLEELKKELLEKY